MQSWPGITLLHKSILFCCNSNFTNDQAAPYAKSYSVSASQMWMVWIYFTNGVQNRNDLVPTSLAKDIYTQVQRWCWWIRYPGNSDRFSVRGKMLTDLDVSTMWYVLISCISCKWWNSQEKCVHALTHIYPHNTRSSKTTLLRSPCQQDI